jgi:AP endonuclease-1
MQYLKALHLNDSKAPFNSHRDLHQNIGHGFLGLRAFHNVMNEPRFHGLPLILETPSERPDPHDPSGKKTIEDKSIWAREIKLLEDMIGMDPESQDFRSLEEELSNKGKKERQEMQAQFDKKQEKEKKKLAKEREKGQRSLNDMFAKGGGQAKKKPTTAAKKKSKRGGESDSSDLSSIGDLSDDEEGHVH